MARRDINQEDIATALKEAGSTKQYIDRQDYVSVMKSLGITNPYLDDQDLSEYIIGGGGPPPVSYDPASSAIFAAFTTPPTDSRKALIDQTVVALKTAGVWAKLDVLYVFAAADKQASKINWVKPGTFNCGEVNGPTFASDRGFIGGATKYLDSTFNAGIAPTPKFVQNSASVFAWSLTSAATATYIAGNNNGGIELIPRYTTEVIHGRINTGAGQSQGPNTDGTGLYVITRSASNVQQSSKNAVGAPTNSAASSGTTTEVWFLRSGAAYWTGQIAVGGIGGNLSAAEQTALYNALNAYISSTRIFAAFVTPPTEARRVLIQNAVSSLITAGVWDKLDALYMFAAADSQAALINWRNPGTFNATNVNSAAFVADRGFTGATTAYIDTGFNPSTATTPKYVLNNASAGIWILTNLASDGGPALGQFAIGATLIFPRYSTTPNARFFRINQGASTQIGTTTTSVGLTAASRTGASAIEGYFNGASVGTAAPASSTVPTTNILLGVNTTGVYAAQIASSVLGGSLTTANQLALYNAKRAYMTGVGVP